MTGKYICNAVLAWREHPVDPFSPLALSLIYGISDVCRNTRTGAELTRAASRTGFLGQISPGPHFSPSRLGVIVDGQGPPGRGLGRPLVSEA